MAEQTKGDRYSRSGYRKGEKRKAAKEDRAAAKKDPENAPKKRRYRGWSS